MAIAAHNLCQLCAAGTYSLLHLQRVQLASGTRGALPELPAALRVSQARSPVGRIWGLAVRALRASSLRPGLLLARAVWPGHTPVPQAPRHVHHVPMALAPANAHLLAWIPAPMLLSPPEIPPQRTERVWLQGSVSEQHACCPQWGTIGICTLYRQRELQTTLPSMQPGRGSKAVSAPAPVPGPGVP